MASPPPTQSTLLGGERGLDHVNIATSDLPGATRVFNKLLGFARPTSGTLPNGIRNTNYYFEDATYLETLTWYDRNKASWVADFTDKHRGGFKLVLSVASAAASARFLRDRGVETLGPIGGTIKTEGIKKNPGKQWHKLLFKHSPLPGDCIFFISYDQNKRRGYLRKLKQEKIRRRFFSHPNTARGIRSAWLAVRNLDQAVKAFSAVGLEAGRSVASKKLNTIGREIIAGRGIILLLQPKGPSGEVAAFLKRRGEGIIGVSIEVKDLRAAQELIQRNTRARLPLHRGFFGESLLISDSIAHGIWMEMFQLHTP